jgi:hypothetical protein
MKGGDMIIDHLLKSIFGYWHKRTLSKMF